MNMREKFLNDLLDMADSTDIKLIDVISQLVNRDYETIKFNNIKHTKVEIPTVKGESLRVCRDVPFLNQAR